MTQQMLLRAMRAGVVVMVLMTVGIALACGVVLLQAQRDEARRVDALLLPFVNAPTPDHMNHVLELYRRGYAPRLIIVGEDPAPIQASLVNQGLPNEAFLTVTGQGSTLPALRSAVDLARQEGIQSVLIADNAGALLLDLKMTRDLGVKAYGSPVPSTQPELGVIFRAGLAYWGYVLFGSG